MTRIAPCVVLLVLVLGCSSTPAPVDAGRDAGPTAPLCIARGLCVALAGAPPPPSGFTSDSCYDGCNWCTCTAEGELDYCTARACLDGGRPTDSGVDAAVETDSGVDAAVDTDAGIDCSTIGCGAPTICGEACTEPCGCCPCADGEEMGATHVCSGGCFAPRGTGATGDVCTATPDCASGLSCCYPCGIPGCTNVCEPTCTAGDPACSGGCLLRP